jgi:hypothetical protein
MRTFIFSFFLFFYVPLFGQLDSTIIRKKCIIQETAISPKIDAEIEEEIWSLAPVQTGFKQAYPNFGLEASFKTEVRLLYDNTAIYILAKMYDDHPDSIGKQLGNRDDYLNADVFRLVFDTYNTQQDAFDFQVTASGVQMDSRFSDQSYNAVWESAVQIVSDGWVAEIKIPFSALRFAKKDIQLWGVQFTRNIFRFGEFDQWALVPQGSNNAIKFWGDLEGMKDVHPPLRLSLQPFITGITSETTKGVYSPSLVGGMDLKYGLNQSYTLDVSLLPDFSQVQNDNLVVNLGAFEQFYNEQRPFFQENIDLFQRGDLFYSRRIGRTPTKYYDVYDELKDGEQITSNPFQAKLLNIAKVSGRSSKGVGIGVLNAVLDNTYAIIEDSLGNQREVLTEPLSNYNIMVFDKQFENSSNIYIINTNVYRAKNGKVSNVTGAGGGWNSKNNMWSAWGNSAVTDVMNFDDSLSRYQGSLGHSYDVGFGKSSGKFTMFLTREALSPGFDNNDMGYNREVNYALTSLECNYFEFESFGKVLRARVGGNVDYENNYTTHQFNRLGVGMGSGMIFKTFREIWMNFNCNPLGRMDYYEPRVDGRYFFRIPNYFMNFGFNSDSRKKMTFSYSAWGGSTTLVSESIGYNPFGGTSVNGSWRATDKLTLNVYGSIFRDYKDRGFVNIDANDDIIFGTRDVRNVSYTFGVRYLFKNNLSLNINGRHYWVRGDYLSFHNLSANGLLLDETGYAENHDFTFNAINFEVLMQWQFAPGSFASLSWKNNGSSYNQYIINDYKNNMSSLLNESALNQFSIKILYYFDFLYLKKKSKKV